MTHIDKDIYLYIIVYFIINILKVFILKNLIYLFLNKKAINKNLECISFLIYYIIVTTTALLIHIPFVTLIINLLGLYIIMYNYRVDFTYRISCSVFVYSIIMIPEIFFHKLLKPKFLDIFKDIKESYLILLIFLQIFILLIYIIITAINRVKNKHKIANAYIFALSCINIVLTLFLFLDTYISSNHFVFYTVTLFIISISSLYAYARLIETYNQKFKLDMLTKQNYYYQNQIDTINKLNKTTKFLKHDYKNHINIINQLLQDKDILELEKYMSSLCQEMHRIDKIVFTENLVIDSILNFKLDEIKSKNISYDFKINIPKNLNVNTLDINILMSNLLDNAIEATSKETNSNNPYIKFALKLVNNIFIIKCENSFDGNIKKNGKYFITTKENFENSGIGIFNIKTVVEKYDGTLNMDFNESCFKTKISLILDI